MSILCGLLCNINYEKILKLTKTVSIKFLNFEFHRLDFNLGGGFLGMRKRALMGCMSQRGG